VKPPSFERNSFHGSAARAPPTMREIVRAAKTKARIGNLAALVLVMAHSTRRRPSPVYV